MTIGDYKMQGAKLFILVLPRIFEGLMKHHNESYDNYRMGP